jgi:alpha-beta hydrolase superfamily lysophospholipase
MPESPTVVMVHGAFADAESWASLTERLLARGHDVAVPPVFNGRLSGE